MSAYPIIQGPLNIPWIIICFNKGPSINYVVSRGRGVKNYQFYLVKRRLRGGEGVKNRQFWDDIVYWRPLSPLNGSMTVVADAQKVITRTPFPKPSTEEFLGCRPAQFYSSQKHFPRTTGNLDLYQICIRRFWAFKTVFPWWESWMLNLIGVNNSFY